jgi:hypothetical protein
MASVKLRGLTYFFFLVAFLLFFAGAFFFALPFLAAIVGLLFGLCDAVDSDDFTPSSQAHSPPHQPPTASFGWIILFHFRSCQQDNGILEKFF